MKPLSKEKVLEKINSGQSLEGAEIGDVDFRNHTFAAFFNFSGAKFMGEASFSGAKFKGNAFFIEAKFESNTYFIGAKFEGDAIFSGATFKGNADFLGAKFEGDAYFMGATFIGDAIFKGATFIGAAIFGGNEGNSVFSLKHETNFTDAFYRVPEKIRFVSVSFEKCLIANKFSDLSKIGFYDVKWLFKNKRRMVYDEYVREESNSKLYYEYMKKTYSELVKNYEDKRRFDEAEDFYYREMEMKRLSKSKPLQFISLLSFYKYLSSYGQGVIRTILVLCFFVLMMFPLLYMQSGIINKERIDRIEYNFPEDIAGITSQKFWRDYKGSITHSLEVSTLKRETLYKSNTEFGHALESFQIILVSIQVALCILAMRRSFRR